MSEIQSMEQLREIIPAPSDKAFAKIRDRLCSQGMAFIERSPFLVLSTIGDWGVEVSSKGDHPGFVEIVDYRTILIPERKGNQFALSLGNILEDPRLGLMFFRPATEEVLRISGRGTLLHDTETCERLSAGGKPAKLVIKVDIDRAAFHCARAAKRAGLWDTSKWDIPMPVSFGRIYAEALEDPGVEELFDKLSKESDAKLY